MALQGTLILNGADYAPFNLYGVGVFMAHSGKGICRNNGGVEIFLTMAHFLPANTGLWIGRRGTGFRKRNAKLLIQPGEQLVSAHLVDRIGLRCGEMIGESTMKHG